MKKKAAVFIAISIFLFSALFYAQIRESGSIQGNISDDEKNKIPGVTIAI